MSGLLARGFENHGPLKLHLGSPFAFINGIVHKERVFPRPGSKRFRGIANDAGGQQGSKALPVNMGGRLKADDMAR